MVLDPIDSHLQALAFWSERMGETRHKRDQCLIYLSRQGLTVRELAEVSRLSPAGVHKIVRGRNGR
jgi:hypothetical protein